MRPSIRSLAHAALLAALASLVACGFQPRQSAGFVTALGQVQVVGAADGSALAAGLRRALERAGASAPAGDASAARLQIFSEGFREGPVSVDRFARIREYQTRYTVDFQVSGAGGDVLVPRQAVELVREYSYDSTRAAGTGEEQEVVREELQREMVAAILRRIDAALR